MSEHARLLRVLHPDLPEWVARHGYKSLHVLLLFRRLEPSEFRRDPIPAPDCSPPRQTEQPNPTGTRNASLREKDSSRLSLSQFPSNPATLGKAAAVLLHLLFLPPRRRGARFAHGRVAELFAPLLSTQGSKNSSAVSHTIDRNWGPAYPVTIAILEADYAGPVASLPIVIPSAFRGRMDQRLAYLRHTH